MALFWYPKDRTDLRRPPPRVGHLEPRECELASPLSLRYRRIADPYLCSMNSMSSSVGIIAQRGITATVGPLANIIQDDTAPMCRTESFQTTHSRRCRPSSLRTAPLPSRSRASRDPGRLRWVWKREDGYRPIRTSWRVSRLGSCGLAVVPCPSSTRQSAYVSRPHPRVGLSGGPLGDGGDDVGLTY